MIVNISGSSGSGKSTLLVRLYEIGYNVIKVTTTRGYREDDYSPFFDYVSKEDFVELIDRGLIDDYQIYNGEYYGCRKEHIEKDKLNFRIAHPRKKENELSIFLDVDISERTKRMIKRGDSSEQIANRIKYDVEHYSRESIKDADYIIYGNLTTEDYVSHIKSILEDKKVI